MEIEAGSTQPSEVASNRDFDVAPEEGRTEEWVNNTSQSVHEQDLAKFLLHLGNHGSHGKILIKILLT